MYAAIIPQIRTLPQLAWFDYKIPDNLTVVPGNLVWIEFRKQKIVGLVWQIKKQTACKSTKSIINVITDYSFTKEQLTFLDWFSKHYAISPALAFKTVFPELLKNKITDRPICSLPITKSKLKINTARLATIKQLLHKLNSDLNSGLIHYNDYADKIALYNGIIQTAPKQVLIITPLTLTAQSLAKQLQKYHPTLIIGNASKSETWGIWKKIQTQKTKVIIGTKSAIFIPIANISTIIVDDEENLAHKNFDQNPRYHVRDIAIAYKEIYPRLKLIFTSQSPSLEANYQLPRYELFNLKNNKCTLINLTTSILNDKLISLISSRKSFLFYNRKGFAKLLICKDCQTIYPFTEITYCSHCHGQNLKPAVYGNTHFKQELQKIFPNKKIVQFDKEHEVTQDFDIALGTEFALPYLNFQQIAFIGILSIDALLIAPDFRAGEKVYQLITYLVNQNKPLCLQTFAPENNTILCALRQDYQEFYKTELAKRELLKYPPIFAKIKLIDKITRKESLVTALPKNLPAQTIIDYL